jgi:hypothetical protein
MMSHFGILSTGTSKDKGLLSSTAFQNPETRNVKSAQEPFRHFSYWNFKGQRGCSSTAFRNPETRNVKSAQEPFRRFGYRDFKEQRVSFCVFSLGHPPWKKQLMNIEQVVETLAQLIKGGHGKGLEQSAHGTLVCRSPCKSHAELRWCLTKEFRPGLTEEPAHTNLDFNVSTTFLLRRWKISLSIYTQFLYFCKDGW